MKFSAPSPSARIVNSASDTHVTECNLNPVNKPASEQNEDENGELRRFGEDTNHYICRTVVMHMWQQMQLREHRRVGVVHRG